MTFLFTDGLNRSVAVSHLLLGLLVPLGYATGNTLVKRRFGDAPIIPLTAWCLGLSALVLVPLGHLTESIETEHLLTHRWRLPGSAWSPPVSCWRMFYYLVQKRGPLYASMVTYLIPLGAIFWGWMIGEAISWQQLAAVGCVMVMVVIAQRGAPEPDESPAVSSWRLIAPLGISHHPSPVTQRTSVSLKSDARVDATVDFDAVLFGGAFIPACTILFDRRGGHVWPSRIGEAQLDESCVQKADGIAAIDL